MVFVIATTAGLKNSQIIASNPACYKTGCSGHICASKQIISTCEWKEEYQCYKDQECIFDSNSSQCQWSDPKALEKCVSGEIPTQSEKKCVVGGCGAACVEEGGPTIFCFAYLPWYKCYKSEYCTRLSDGNCGFTNTREIEKCVEETKNPTCIRSGCSGELCVPEGDPRTELSGICQWKPEYDCYRNAKCSSNELGQCNWEQTKELDKCIEKAKRKDFECVVDGCNGEICRKSTDLARMSPCVYKPELACYKEAECFKTGNDCKWKTNARFNVCLLRNRLTARTAAN